MRAKEIHKNAKSFKRVLQLFKQAIRDGAYRVSRRLHTILLNMEGHRSPQIATLLKVHHTNVSIWLRNWEEQGFQGVLEGYRPGRPSELTKNQVKELEDILESGPVAYGFKSGVWTCPMVVRVIEKDPALLSFACPAIHGEPPRETYEDIKRSVFGSSPLLLGNQSSFSGDFVFQRGKKQSEKAMRRHGCPMLLRGKFIK